MEKKTIVDEEAKGVLGGMKLSCVFFFRSRFSRGRRGGFERKCETVCTRISEASEKLYVFSRRYRIFTIGMADAGDGVDRGADTRTYAHTRNTRRGAFYAARCTRVKGHFSSAGLLFS